MIASLANRRVNRLIRGTKIAAIVTSHDETQLISQVQAGPIFEVCDIKYKATFLLLSQKTMSQQKFLFGIGKTLNRSELAFRVTQ